MRIIEVCALDNGAHRNQESSAIVRIPSGWAAIPETIDIPYTFPFVGVTAENGIVTGLTPGILPDTMLEEVQSAKLAEINTACNAAITAGCDVKLADGTTGHISLSIPDQINLSSAQSAIAAGKTGYAYHLDGSLCEIYPAADVVILAETATRHVLYHQTYCNHARAWVKRCRTVAEVEAIAYGAVLPEDLAAHMAAVLGGGNA